MMSTSNGPHHCQPSNQPHLLSSSALQSSYDAVVPSNTHTSSSSCTSFPPFDDPGDHASFEELYQQQGEGRMILQCGQDSMMQQELYCAPLSTLLCKM